MIEYLLLKFLHIKAGPPQENPVDFLEVLMGNSSVRWIDAARFLEDRGDGWTFLAVLAVRIPNALLCLKRWV